MKNNAFGGYDKPNFQPKNLTSDMWEPITSTNNFSAYTPQRPAENKEKASSSAGTQRVNRTSASNEQRVRRQEPDRTKKKSVKARKKIEINNLKKPKAERKEKNIADKRPISDGNSDNKKPKNNKAPSKAKQSITEKRRNKTNQAFVRLVKSGKTPDEARLIINKRKIRKNKIKTLGTVAFFTVFALCFLLSYGYFRGAEIKEIIFVGDEVYTETEILEAGNISVGLNMLTVREKKLNDDVTKVLPFISEIDVDYQLPDVLSLNVISTQEQLILKCDRKYICVDKTGKVVSDKKKKLTEGQFLVQGLVEQEYTVGESFSVSQENAERFRIASEFAKLAEGAETLNYGVLDLKDLQDIRFTYRSKIRLYLGDSSNLTEKLEKAVGIMQSADIGDKTGYINLKYDIGAYFMEGAME